MYQFSHHPRHNAQQLTDKLVREYPRAAVTAMANLAWREGRREIPVEPSPKKYLELTDWLAYSHENYRFMYELALAACHEYTHRFSDYDDETGARTEAKTHEVQNELKILGNIYLANIIENGRSDIPCELVEFAREMSRDHVERMRITFAVTDSTGEKWTRRSKPEWITVLAREYNEHLRRKKDRAKRQASRAAEIRVENQVEQARRDRERGRIAARANGDEMPEPFDEKKFRKELDKKTENTSQTKNEKDKAK